MSATIDNSTTKKYAAKTSFIYVTGDGKEYVGISMRTGKIVDSTENKTYASLEKWLEELPGSPTIDRVTIKEPEAKKAKEKTDLKKHQYTFNKLCPTYDMAVLLFAHEEHILDDSITSSNKKYRPGNIYAEDYNGDLVMIHYNRWKIVMSRNDDSDKQLESIYFEGIGIKPDTKLYISSKYTRRYNTSGDGAKIICYKPPFTKENWKEYINRPFIFYSNDFFTNEETIIVREIIKQLEKNFNIIKINNNSRYTNSISSICDTSEYRQLFDKIIVLYKYTTYNNINNNIKQINKYYITNNSIKDNTRGCIKSENFEETITNLKKACNVMLGITK